MCIYRGVSLTTRLTESAAPAAAVRLMRWIPRVTTSLIAPRAALEAARSSTRSFLVQPLLRTENVGAQQPLSYALSRHLLSGAGR